jgi:hypothetical protein
LLRRGGSRRITSSAYGEDVTSLFAYRRAVGSWLLLVGARESIGKLDGSEVVKIPHVSLSSFTDDINPWKFEQYNDIAYAARANGGLMKHIDGDRILDAGILAPSAAASAAEGAAGALDAGTYRYVVTFVNLSTDAESDFSPEASVTIGASKRVNLTSVPTSTNPQVTGRRIYRTLKDATGEYFLAGTISDAYSTTFEDNVLDEDLGDSASIENGIPPANFDFIEIWRERMWGTDGRSLWPSRIGKPEQFNAALEILVFPDDGHEIRGMQAYGDRFLIGKTNATHYLVGTDVSDFNLHTLSDKHGVGSGHSMAVAEGIAFWLGMDDFYITDGQAVRGVGSTRVRDRLEAIPDSIRRRCVSYVVPEEGWYVTTIPQDETGGFDEELVYNYKNDTWQVFKRTTLGAPVFAGEFVDENFNRIQYGSFDSGHIYQLHTGNDDDGNAIVAKVRTKAFGFDMHNLLKWLRRLHVKCPSIAEELTVRIYRDEEDASVAERVVSLNQQRPWKRLFVSNSDKMGATVSVELEYSGSRSFRLDALSFELAQHMRSSKAV